MLSQWVQSFILWNHKRVRDNAHMTEILISPPKGLNLQNLIIFLYTKKRSIFHVPANTSAGLPEKIIHMFQCCASSHQTAGTTGRSGPEGRISAHSHKPPPIMKDIAFARLSSGHRWRSDCFSFIVLSLVHGSLKTTHRIYNK